jgi:hypothetical protein
MIGKNIILILLSALMVLPMGLILGCNEKSKERDQGHISILIELLNKLESSQPLTHEKCEKIFNTKMIAYKGLNPYYDIRHGVITAGKTSEIVAEIELRTPIISERRGSLLIIDLKKNVNITDKDIMKLFPEKPEFHPKPPNAPASVPDYLVVNKPWGKLSFGISRDEDRLVSVVIDTIR